MSSVARRVGIVGVVFSLDEQKREASEPAQDPRHHRPSIDAMFRALDVARQVPGRVVRDDEVFPAAQIAARGIVRVHLADEANYVVASTFLPSYSAPWSRRWLRIGHCSESEGEKLTNVHVFSYDVI